LIGPTHIHFKNLPKYKFIVDNGSADKEFERKTKYFKSSFSPSKWYCLSPERYTHVTLNMLPENRYFIDKIQATKNNI